VLISFSKLGDEDDMDSQTRMDIVKRIDASVEEQLKKYPGGKVQDLMRPEMEKIATETGIDMVDIFIAYMDHVAYTSKKMAAEAEVNITAEDVDNNNIKLYPTQK